MCFLALFLCFCGGRAQSPSWRLKSPMAWVNLAFGFQCSPRALAHECSWWLAQWRSANCAYCAVRHLLCQGKRKVWVMVMSNSAAVPGLDESPGLLHRLIKRGSKIQWAATKTSSFRPAANIPDVLSSGTCGRKEGGKKKPTTHQNPNHHVPPQL